MSVLILVDFQADNIAQDPRPLKRLKEERYLHTHSPKLILASRRYGTKDCKKDSKGARVHPFVTKIASTVVTKQAVGPSAFEGGTLRPIVSTERIVKSAHQEVVIVCGYFLEWAVAQTAFDANALGFQTKVDLSLTASEAGTDLTDLANLSFEENAILGRLEKAGVQAIVSEPATLS